MLEKIFSVKNENEYKKVITILGIKINIKRKHKILAELNRLKVETEQIRNSLMKITPQSCIRMVAVHLCNHCNLNCVGCDHFSPLAQEKYADIESFERDFKRLSELTNGNISKFALQGGEPLLHPQVTAFCEIARKYFPESNVTLTTNGILLNKMSQEFWDVCSKNNIVIEMTKYPINLDFENIVKLAEDNNVKLSYVNTVQKTSYKIPLDLEGCQNPGENFLNCFHANHCVFLKDGRLYTCTVAPNIEHFNKFFDKNIPLSSRDGIDIYEAENYDEILSFLAKPIPFCRFCNVKGRTFSHKWRLSKKELEEWV